MIPKSRLDALTDGVFAVAMTLLVIDLRLPEAFTAQSDGELLHWLAGLGHQLLVYAVSFYVLALCWMGQVRIAARSEEAGQRHAVLALTYLLLVTLLPFSTMVVGRYPHFPVAVGLYAANMIAIALVALRMLALSGDGRRSRMGLYVLIGSALLTVALSLWLPRWAMFAYLLNLLDGPLLRWRRRRAE